MPLFHPPCADLYLLLVLFRLGDYSLDTFSGHNNALPTSVLLGCLDFIISSQKAKLKSVQLYLLAEREKLCLPLCVGLGVHQVFS